LSKNEHFFAKIGKNWRLLMLFDRLFAPFWHFLALLTVICGSKKAKIKVQRAKSYIKIQK